MTREHQAVTLAKAGVQSAEGHLKADDIGFGSSHTTHPLPGSAHSAPDWEPIGRLDARFRGHDGLDGAQKRSLGTREALLQNPYRKLLECDLKHYIFLARLKSE